MKNSWINCGGHFDVAKQKEQIAFLESETARDGFWNSASQAQEVLKKISDSKASVDRWEQARQFWEDTNTLFELAVEANDPASLAEVETQLKQLGKFCDAMEMTRMLAGPQDGANAFLQINAGAGGTESCDWVAILLRMYSRYCAAHDYKAEIIDYTDGEGAGYRSITLMISGTNVYGYLKAENGVHRLVRISPFDANKRRHTSFASVFVYPDVEDDIEITINPADLRVDTYRAGGAGGQKVNKTDSAVRLTHYPSGIVVQCQNERSQHQNKATAMKILKARLFEKELQEKQKAKDQQEAEKKDISWGSQIRSYVLHPYQLIKDHRTNHESSQSQAVLDGDLDEFIRKYLLYATDKGD